MTELDIERPEELLAYLREAGLLRENESPGIERLTGGVSNRTVLVTRENGEAWVVKQALAKLRVEVDWFGDPRRIEREANGLRHLERVLPAGSITPLLFEDPARHLLVMTAVPRPHRNWKEMLLAGRLEQGHVDQFADLLARLHRSSFGRRDLAEEFGDRSHFETLRLEPYYGYVAERCSAVAAFLRELIEDTLATRLTLVHGDYSPKNVLVREERLVLLDHEVIHFGDPGFDVGFGLTHLLSKAHHLAARRAAFAGAAHLFWQRYRAGLGGPQWAESLERRAVRHTLGCLLARVAGRSRLEYLTPPRRRRQLDVAAGLSLHPPRRMPELIDAFLEGL